MKLNNFRKKIRKQRKFDRTDSKKNIFPEFKLKDKYKVNSRVVYAEVSRMQK